MSRSKIDLDAVAWVFGVTAITLAILLRVVFQVPLPLSVAQSPESLRIASDGHTAEMVGSARELPLACSIAIHAAAIVGLVAGCIAVWRDRTSTISGPALALCLLALFWHYVLVVFMSIVSVMALILLLRILLLAC